MLYAVIATNVAAVAAVITIARDGFETRLITESLSIRPRASSAFWEKRSEQLAHYMAVKPEGAEAFHAVTGGRT